MLTQNHPTKERNKTKKEHKEKIGVEPLHQGVLDPYFEAQTLECNKQIDKNRTKTNHLKYSRKRNILKVTSQYTKATLQ